MSTGSVAADGVPGAGLPADVPAADDQPPLQSLLVVGCGLVGTSIALAAAGAGIEVWLDDVDAHHLEVAVARGAGKRWGDVSPHRVDHAVLCVPPRAIAKVYGDLFRLDVASTYSDVASVKAKVQREIKRCSGEARFVGGHPMAGGERHGPWHARGDLFAGRAWVLTPTAATDPAAVAAASRLARCCGAVVVTTTPERHDESVALVSHLPQLVASALAATLGSAQDQDLTLAGQGLRDMTRIAGSDPELWAEILADNRVAVRSWLDLFRREIDAASAALAGEDDASAARTGEQRGGPALDAVADLIARGRSARARIPGKHGTRGKDFPAIAVVLADRPGELASVLATLAEAHLNVEDMRLDHAPGQATGVLEIALQPAAADQAADLLRARGWTVGGGGHEAR